MHSHREKIIFNRLILLKQIKNTYFSEKIFTDVCLIDITSSVTEQYDRHDLWSPVELDSSSNFLDLAKKEPRKGCLFSSVYYSCLSSYIDVDDGCWRQNVLES